jgi:tetratricopeptide (TPR) repeat protein
MDTLEYIDGYFSGEYPPDEAGVFEKKIEEDPVFAGQVAYYLSARAAFKEMHAEQRKKRFRELLAEQAKPAVTVNMGRRRWVVALSAAVVIGVLALGWLVFLRPVDGSRLADRYIRENLGTLSARMGAGDSIQTGIVLYNRQQYPDALHQFEHILLSDPTNLTALLDAGIVALRMDDYEKALANFSKLQTLTDPHINPALFYEAITRLKRDHTGDLALSKRLLHRIVEEDLNRKADAEQLLKRL